MDGVPRLLRGSTSEGSGIDLPPVVPLKEEEDQKSAARSPTTEEPGVGGLLNSNIELFTAGGHCAAGDRSYQNSSPAT